MLNYNQLKEKWVKLAGETKAWDYAEGKFGPNVVGIHFCEGGFSSCGPVFEDHTIFFDNTKEAVAFYRFAHIPFFLDSETQSNCFPNLEDFDKYMSKLPEGNFKNDLSKLVNELDDYIKKDKNNRDEFASIIELINKIFKNTNYQHEIHAWGPIRDLLKFECFTKMMEDDIELEEEGNNSVTRLKKLLDAGLFNEQNEDHLELVKEFFENHKTF